MLLALLLAASTGLSTQQARTAAPTILDAAGVTTEGSSLSFSRADHVHALTYTASGGTARSLASKLGDVVSVKDFGAKGDGTTDDTTALNTAGASGARVLLLPGTYKVSGSVVLSAGTVFFAVDGAQSVLAFSGTPTATGNAAVSLAGVGAGIEGIGINVTAGDYRRVVDHRASYTFTRRCKINFTSPNVNAAAFAYVLWAATGSNITNVVMDGNDIQGNATNLSDGVQASNAPGIRVTNNRIHDFTTAQTGDTKFSWGIYVSSQSPGALIAGNIIQNVNVSGIHKNDSAPDPGARIVDNYIDTATNVGLSVQNAPRAVIRGNQISNCDLLFSLDSANATVSGNVFDTVVTRAAGSISANKPLIELTANASGSTLTGNVFGAAGGALMGVDNSAGATDVTFTANQWLSGSPKQPINSAGARTLMVGNEMTWTSASAQYPLISGADSTFASNIVNIPTGGVGIRMTGNNAQIHSNRLIGGNFAVWVSGGSGASVRNNIAGGQASTVYNYSGATAVMARGNKYGTGASQGTATLVAGAVTVSTTEIQTGDTVVVTRTTTGGTAGFLSVGTITNATSFVINSSSGADTSVVAWEIVH